MGIVYSLPISVFLLYLLSTLISFLHKFWWNPIQIQKAFSSQGIKGPPYKFLHGNNKQVLKMLTESMNKPMEEKFSHNIFPKIQPHIYSWINIYGKNFLTWHGSRPQLNVTEPDLIKEILNNKDGLYVKPKVEGYLKKLLGNGLPMITEAQTWANRRKLANHAFRAESLKGMVPEMVSAVEIMLERWRKHEGKEIEVFEEFRLLTSEVISRTAFGSSYKEGKNIFKMLIRLASILSTNSLKIRFPGVGKIIRTQDEVESEKIEQEIQKSILEIIKRREEKVKKGELDGYGSDYLGLLIKANKDEDESKRISIEDMIDECKSFYFAGHETTTSLLTWTCLLLAINQDWQDKARKEVIELIGENNPTPDGNFISRLKTMTMIINESLRLYPPILGYSRKVTREVRLGNLILPANMEVRIFTMPMQHDPEIWGEDVHIFKPERFSEGTANATMNKTTMALIPFGFGPRICVGLNFAMIETKIALAMILQRYHFTVSPAYVHSPTLRITSRPLHGLQIMLQTL